MTVRPNIVNPYPLDDPYGFFPEPSKNNQTNHTKESTATATQEHRNTLKNLNSKPDTTTAFNTQEKIDSALKFLSNSAASLNESTDHDHFPISFSFSHNSIKGLDIKENLENIGIKATAGYGNITISEDTMRIVYVPVGVPNRGNELEALDITSTGKNKEDNPKLAELLAQVQRAIPQDQLNLKQKEAFTQFFKGNHQATANTF
jgi:hypothetical protein